MEKLNALIGRYYRQTLLILSVLIFFNTCGNPNRSTNKKIQALHKDVQALSTRVDSLATKGDVSVEGLLAEKRMIQSTNRKLWDLNRENEIDRLLQKTKR